MRRFLLLLLVLLSTAALFAQSKPNIVYIMADDMGYGDPGANNPHSRMRTPNIDRLAAQSIRFTDAHAPASVCVPSRYGLLTGRYPSRAKLDWRHEAVISPEHATLASMLKQAGYVTAMVGKWHEGFEGGPDYDFSQPMRGGPVDRGFDTYFGIPQSLDQPPYYYVRDRSPVEPPTNEIGDSATEGWSPIQGAFWRAGGIAPGFKHEEVLPTFEKETVRVIQRHTREGGGKPLFLYVAFPAPHTPWLPLERFRGKSDVGLYGDFVMQVDHTVGEILGALDEAGLAENTLVIFTSDNGPVWYEEDVLRFSHDSAGPLRGMKGDAWEAGHRVPFFARWPGRIESGTLSSQLLCFTDMMATFAAIAGAEKPASAVDSLNMLPALQGKARGAIRETLILKEDRSVVRQGRWKLITHIGSGGFSEPRRVDTVEGGPQGQLYNLADDLSETRNLWLERPEVVERMMKLLE